MGTFKHAFRFVKKNQLLCVIAIVVSGAVFWEVHSFLNQRENHINDPRYLVAKRDLLSGQPIALVDFSFVHTVEQDDKGVTDQQLHLLNHAVLVSSLSRGDILTWEKLRTSSKNRNWGQKIPKGLRAYSLRPANFLHLFPKDRVDIVLKPSQPKQQPVTLVEGVLVLHAVMAQGVLGIVIAVSRHEIQLLEKALQRGTLTVALRNPDELYSDSSRIVKRQVFSKQRKKEKIQVWMEAE